MIGFFSYICELKKELLVGISISIIYITYYLVEAVKKPVIICRKGEFLDFLEEKVPLLNERYWPTPWCVESRLQTVIGSLLRTRLLSPVQYRREVLTLSDGGQVALDWAIAAEDGAGVKEGGKGGAGVMLVLPGVTGDARADYVRCLVAAAVQLRLRCVVVNYRGLGGLPLTTPRLYSAVSHSDLAEAVRAIEKKTDGPLVATGVSLGGLVLTQYLAASADSTPLLAALVVSSPLDVVRGSECIERWPVNALLSYHIARNLRRAVEAMRTLGAVLDWGALERCRSVRQFDSIFTAPHFGFPTVDDYYREASLRGKLNRVRVPLLCLCAADDPFQPLEVIPTAEAAESERVALAVTARGGHIGFLEGWWPSSPPRDHYLSRLAVQYFGAILKHPDILKLSNNN
ncbi:unnamed protein product [Chilo suppressalis]|uniref:AB hydrolase-1 domain-containing protein n=1 Tax=Chilo suppressalis TaxID=168631 RepID=A0ABN8BFR7_CHISP|nr:hypothetical protein evm_000976 [Chilo suppressalis]CAH0405541.1 unnamed protein product [Chilo suppressalis]